jgi:shikimate kinase
MRYFLIGFMGSGKSYWGKRWSEAFDMPLVDLDAEIEKFAGKSIPEIFKEKGEAYFRKIERKVLHQFFKKDHFIMSCGGGTPCYFDNMRKMNKHGITIYLKSSPELLAERLRDEKTTRPLLKDIADDMLVDFIEQKLETRRKDYAQSIYHLESQYVTNDNFERIIRRHGA